MYKEYVCDTFCFSMKICSFFLSLVFLVSCQNNENHLVENKNEFKTERIEEEVITANSFLEKKHTDSILFQRNLVDVQSIDPTIQVELKYTTTDNFIGEILYTRIKNAYLQKDVAERLSKCQSLLKSIHPSYSLLIYDAVRPVSVQQKMWDALDTIPRYERGKFVSNPAHRSLHNYGAAVDVTIVDERVLTAEELPEGAATLLGEGVLDDVERQPGDHEDR